MAGRGRPPTFVAVGHLAVGDQRHIFLWIMDTSRFPDDTSAEVTRVQFALYNRMTVAERVRRVSELTLTANACALAGLRRRHPGATERELLLRLAVLRLGEETVANAYDWRPPRDGA